MLRRSTLAALCLALTACGGGADEGNTQAAAAGNGAGSAGGAQMEGAQGPRQSLLDSMSANRDHATLVKAVKAAGLTETLSGSQPYTVFAPTEAALGKLPPGTTDSLLAPEQRGQLTALLTGHIVPGTVTAQDLGRAIERGKGKAQLATVGGTNLSFARDGEALVVTDGSGGSARVVAADGAAANGVIHSIDGVLMPAR
jgi:uncharacterized surface protein with fasciclin (FAS1) repeats